MIAAGTRTWDTAGNLIQVIVKEEIKRFIFSLNGNDHFKRINLV